MFLMMYRCYTVDILKTVIKTRFTQVCYPQIFLETYPTEKYVLIYCIFIWQSLDLENLILLPVIYISRALHLLPCIHPNKQTNNKTYVVRLRDACIGINCHIQICIYTKYKIYCIYAIVTKRRKFGLTLPGKTRDKTILLSLLSLFIFIIGTVYPFVNATPLNIGSHSFYTSR